MLASLPFTRPLQGPFSLLPCTRPEQPRGTEDLNELSLSAFTPLFSTAIAQSTTTLTTQN